MHEVVQLDNEIVRQCRFLQHAEKTLLALGAKIITKSADDFCRDDLELVTGMDQNLWDEQGLGLLAGASPGHQSLHHTVVFNTFTMINYISHMIKVIYASYHSSSSTQIYSMSNNNEFKTMKLNC